MDKHNVIIVTDGDRSAGHAMETAAANIGGRCISASAGNPTPLTGYQIVSLIKAAGSDPVVVMVDDRGKEGAGKGEYAMKIIMESGAVNVLGIAAVSSNGSDCNGLRVTCSVTREGRVIEGAVDKYGNAAGGNEICGDTLSVLKGMENILVVGMGDPGKMDFYDGVYKGAPVSTKVLREIIKRSGYRPV